MLQPLLEEKLDELGIRPRIFLDTQQLERGDWPEHLARAHGRSRTFLPVLCAPYFQSGWCTSEWVNAIERERQERARQGNLVEIVVPVIFNDCSDSNIEAIPDPRVRDHVRARVRCDLHDFSCLANPRADTDSAEQFRRTIERLCTDRLVPAIEAAPLWQADWPCLPTRPILGQDPSWTVRM